MVHVKVSPQEPNLGSGCCLVGVWGGKKRHQAALGETFLTFDSPGSAADQSRGRSGATERFCVGRGAAEGADLEARSHRGRALRYGTEGLRA